MSVSGGIDPSDDFARRVEVDVQEIVDLAAPQLYAFVEDDPEPDPGSPLIPAWVVDFGDGALIISADRAFTAMCGDLEGAQANITVTEGVAGRLVLVSQPPLSIQTV